MARRARKPRKPSRKGVMPGAVRLFMLGDAKSITYRHADGRLMKHTFRAGVRLGYTEDGKALVIEGAAVKPFIEG